MYVFVLGECYHLSCPSGLKTTHFKVSVPRGWSPLMLPLGARRPLGGQGPVCRVESRLALRGGQVTPTKGGKGKEPTSLYAQSQCVNSSHILRASAAVSMRSKGLCLHPRMCLHREQVLADPNNLSAFSRLQIHPLSETNSGHLVCEDGKLERKPRFIFPPRV